MPPILKSDIQKPGVGAAKAPVVSLDREKHMKIEESIRGGKPYFEVFSVSGRLLGAATTRAKVVKLRDTYPLTTCLS